MNHPRKPLNNAELERLSDWIRCGNVKLPALTVACAMLSPEGDFDSGETVYNPWPYPTTVHQFVQCRHVLNLIPAQWGAAMETLAEKSRVWKRLSERWAELDGIHNAGGEGYESRICEILDECENDA